MHVHLHQIAKPTASRVEIAVALQMTIKSFRSQKIFSHLPPVAMQVTVKVLPKSGVVLLGERVTATSDITVIVLESLSVFVPPLSFSPSQE
jgi:hypothetical protein